jgi:NAD(P)-dependent dehydrogenase (short-subunit alcohol dehydrogenase family)
MEPSDMEHDGPVLVVIGATGGIGAALSRLLAAQGARVVVAGRDLERARVLAGEVEGEPMAVDATDAAQVEVVMARAVERFGRLDGVANCVGSLLLKPAHLTTPAEWEQVLHTNLTSAFNCVRAAVRLLRARGGAIVLVSSAAARIGLANHEAIAAAKAGVAGLVQSAAASYAAANIRINGVAPGLVRTPLTARITGNANALRASTAMHALGRIGEPEDVAGAIAWLLHPSQSWITGQVIAVDGGLSTIQRR